MSFLSYAFRDARLCLLCFGAYLARLPRRASESRLPAESGLRVFMDGRGLEGTAARKELTGIGRYVDELAHRLLETDPGLCLRLYSSREASIPEAGARYVNCVCRTRSAFSRLLSGDLAEYRADLLHITDTEKFFSHMLPLLFAPVSIVTVHDVIPLMWPGYYTPLQKRLYRALLRWTCRRCSAVLVDSEHARADLQGITNIPDERLHVIYLGVDVRYRPITDADTLQQARAKYDLAGPYILSIGRSAPHKNLPVLVQAVKRLRDGGLDLKLALIGPNDTSAGVLELERALREANAQDWVRWTGFVEDADLPALYNAAEVFAFPSRYEGFGLPLLEAMACGTPVVSSQSTSLPEVAGAAALLVDASDPAALAEGLCRALTDSALRAELIRRGLERAAQFSWEATAQRTLEVYYSAWKRKKEYRTHSNDI